MTLTGRLPKSKDVHYISRFGLLNFKEYCQIYYSDKTVFNVNTWLNNNNNNYSRFPGWVIQYCQDFGTPTPTPVCVLCLVAQWCPTLCYPLDCSPPGSSVHGILQARILEWVAIPSSRGSSQLRDQIQVSCTADRFLMYWTTCAPPAYPCLVLHLPPGNVCRLRSNR